MELTAAETVTVTVVAIAAVVGMVAVAETLAVVAVELIETGASQGLNGISVDLGTVILEIPSPHLHPYL